MNPSFAPSLALVGDIGGTHARFAIARLGGPRPELGEPVKLAHAGMAGPDAVVEAFLAQVGEARPAHIAVAVAGPVDGGAARFTNLPWSLSEAALRQDGFETAVLINDFEAMAWALPALSPDETVGIGADVPPESRAARLVLGPGTGFGAAVAAPCGAGFTAMATEPGHMGFAPTDEVELELWRRLSADGRVTVESLVCGPGLKRLHRLLAEIEGRPPEPLEPTEITARALAGSDPHAMAAAERFCALLGSVAGDLALATGARGGVYLVGGMARGIEPLLLNGPFRRRFEDKPPMHAYLAQIPTRLVRRKHTALLGAALALTERLKG